MPPSHDGNGLVLNVFFDGACFPNPGSVMGLGAVILEGRRMLCEISRRVDEPGTNNVAEYMALIAGLEEAAGRGAAVVRVNGDSQLVIRQMNGEYRVNDVRLRKLHGKARETCRGFVEVTFRHIPREKNTWADELSKKAAGTDTGDRARKEMSTAAGYGDRECPRCGKALIVTRQRFKNGKVHLRGECPEHGFVKYVSARDEWA